MSLRYFGVREPFGCLEGDGEDGTLVGSDFERCSSGAVIARGRNGGALGDN